MTTKKKKNAKPKKRTAFQSLIASIERSNKSFKRSGQARKIVMVAQDVLDLLTLKRIKATPGTYVQLPALSERRVKGLKDISELLKLPTLPSCDVCAIGAGMLAATLRLDHVPIARDDTGAVCTSAGYNTSGVLSAKMSDRAADVFPDELLRDMENAFERYHHGYDHLSAAARLEAIYKNLIKNKGKMFTNHDDPTEVIWAL
jgi:hypothetical protein